MGQVLAAEGGYFKKIASTHPYLHYVQFSLINFDYNCTKCLFSFPTDLNLPPCTICVGRVWVVIVFFFLEKQTFNGLLKVIDIQKLFLCKDYFFLDYFYN